MALLGHLGGLGSRARHGFGSVSIKSLTGYLADSLPSLPSSASEFADWLKKVVKPAARPEPPFSAFWKRDSGQVFTGSPGGDAMTVLGNEAARMQEFRCSSRDKGKLKNRNVLCKEDADYIKELLGPKTKADHAPNRIIFGLPNNYHVPNKGEIEVNAAFDENGMERRASPLILHIHQFGKDYIPIYTLFQSIFLPEDKKGNLRINNERVNASPNWDLLQRFIDGMPGKEVAL
jgi:CRISPR-associated protein Cmr1